MTKQLGELKISKNADYYNKVVESLEAEGFIMVLQYETTSDRYYIIAEKEAEEWQEKKLRIIIESESEVL